MYQYHTPDHDGAKMTAEKAYILAVHQYNRGRVYGVDYWFTPANDQTPPFGDLIS